MQDHYIGVDVGGTKTEVCLLTLKRGADFRSHQVLATKRMPTGRTTSLADFLNRLYELFASVLTPLNLKMSDLRGVGIGLPGSIEPRSQVMVAGSIPFFLNVPLTAPFRKALNYSGTLAFDNDANCFALAEAYFGAGVAWAEQNNLPMEDLCMIGIILGTGVGGGVLVRGELVRGRRGGAGEIGHTSLIDNGRSCYCGEFGCSEQYLSGPAFEHAYAARATHSEPLSGIEIFKRIEDGDPVALATLEHYREHLVKFLSNLCNTLDPHVIVLGGGMSQQAGIYTGISDRLGKECFLTIDPPDVVPYLCGDSSGVIGAALLSFAAIRAQIPEGTT
jgi:fructokinase